MRPIEIDEDYARAAARLAADLLDAAMVVTHAEAGHVQLRDGNSGVRTVALGGLPRSFGAVVDGDSSVRALWRRVLELRRRIVVSDLFEARPWSSTSEDALRAVGLHATQVSPIISSRGELVGVLSTHARRARTFSEDELTRLDLLLERAADFLVHAPAEGRGDGRFADAATVDENLPPRRMQLDLRVAVGRALDLITPQIRAHGQELTVCLGADPAWIAGDQHHLVQAFASLLRNAVTHTPPSGRLSVFVHVSSGWASVHITDSGAGIARKALDQIFAPRSSLVNGQRRGDHELSLAEVRQLIDRHEGEVAAQSDGPGQGSRFVVRLPVVAAYRSNRRA